MNLFGSVVTACLLLCVSAKNSTKDVIGFPESEENPDLKNKDNRQPVYIPAMCPDNELYYPGDQKDDWICDCRPSYLYHPKSDACWPAYRKGPCEDDQYLLLHQNTYIPVCEKNPCVVDGFVSWNGQCERLGSTAPCNSVHMLPASLGVNATSLVVSCIQLTVPSRFAEVVSTTSSPSLSVNVCLPGCKRKINGKCDAGK